MKNVEACLALCCCGLLFHALHPTRHTDTFRGAGLPRLCQGRHDVCSSGRTAQCYARHNPQHHTSFKTEPPQEKNVYFIPSMGSLRRSGAHSPHHASANFIAAMQRSPSSAPCECTGTALLITCVIAWQARWYRLLRLGPHCLQMPTG